MYIYKRGRLNRRLRYVKELLTRNKLEGERSIPSCYMLTSHFEPHQSHERVDPVIIPLFTTRTNSHSSDLHLGYQHNIVLLFGKLLIALQFQSFKQSLSLAKVCPSAADWDVYEFYLYQSAYVTRYSVCTVCTQYTLF